MPLRHPDRTWGGPGAGESCAVCERPITKDQLELEIQFARVGGATPRLDKFHRRGSSSGRSPACSKPLDFVALTRLLAESRGD
jgi:hypothetical protein